MSLIPQSNKKPLHMLIVQDQVWNRVTENRAEKKSTRWKVGQDEVIEALGEEYHNYNLVFAGALGLPTEGSTIRGALQRLIKDNDLPPVVFHSFRHSSITYKLKLNGGDIKAVQGDSGHSQVKMVTDVYSHILDEDRKANAML